MYPSGRRVGVVAVQEGSTGCSGGAGTCGRPGGLPWRDGRVRSGAWPAASGVPRSFFNQPIFGLLTDRYVFFSGDSKLALYIGLLEWPRQAELPCTACPTACSSGRSEGVTTGPVAGRSDLAEPEAPHRSFP